MASPTPVSTDQPNTGRNRRQPAPLMGRLWRLIEGRFKALERSFIRQGQEWELAACTALHQPDGLT
ncbi:hypothetical protein [Spirosoma rhododendri]|uniref:Uncharacterized protein n=1 Tax=Spirosoma rhododendri TaxID=2728024 RepID=A0A7L5DG30_9BACT|nr:hypothetical protein [Spirosoma rhododendri]QJD77164.1 hypothetical protein HH216_01075 [Spirosoma rhododendri]